MIKFFVSVLVFVIDTLYRDRPYQRFYLLETVARVPYFSYLSVLHLYETLGWWRKADWLKVHFAQAWNELHHLLIMESLGGNKSWSDRFVAQHAAFFYYWVIVALYMVAPRSAYHFYDVFVNIRDDEGQHVKTMLACQQADAPNTFKSPHRVEH